MRKKRKFAIVNNPDKERKNKKIFMIILFSFFLFFIVLFGILAFLYYQTPTREIRLGASIGNITFSEDGSKIYIRLAGGSNEKNITKVKFIFTDFLGGEHVFETTKGASEISTPFSYSFIDWLFVKPVYEGAYDYEINAEEVGLDSFEDIVEISVLFEYWEEGQLIDTEILDTEQSTTPTISDGGGGGGDDDSPPTPCTDTCGSLEYECGTQSVCGSEVSCGECGDEETCKNGKCIFSWQLVNEGNPIDIWEDIDYNPALYADSYFSSITDSEGNLVYFFSSYPTGKIMGRINKEQKSYEIFTFEEWSSDPNKIARSLSESIFLTNKMYAFNVPGEPGKLFVVESNGIKSALNSLDVHGSIYNLIFDGEDFLYWNRTGYEKYNAMALLYSWTGSSFSKYSFDMNENLGILIGTQGVYRSKNTFTAAKYDILSENWGAWNDGWMFPYENIKTTIPLQGISPTENFGAPVIKNIPETNDFILTYLHEENMVYDVRAAKYDNLDEKWLVWNGNWNPNEQVPLLEGGIINRPTIVRGNKLYMFYKNGNYLNLGIYDNAESSWNFKEILSTDSNLADFVIKLDSNNKIWVVYKDEGKIKYSVETNENWEDSQVLYNNDSEILDVNFVENVPVVFIIKEDNGKNRLYAISNSSSFWDSEQVRVPLIKREPFLLNEEKIKLISKFENDVKYEIFNGTGYCAITNSYGSKPAGHMEIDSENELYAPRVSVSNIGIFPENYTEPLDFELSNAHNWGNFWDHLYFPSSVSVDNKRNWTFITDYIVNGGGGDLGIGNLQIWDKEKKSENLMWKVLGGDCKPEINYQTYFPKKISGFNYPSDSAIDEENGYLYVTDSLNNKIQKFDLNNFVDGKPVKIKDIGIEGSGNLEFKFPQGIDTDAEGSVYVVDTNNHRIQKFDKDDNFILSWGGLGDSPGKFIYPYGISVDKVTEKIFVSDPYNFRIQIFDLQGNYLYSFGKWYEGENLVSFSEKKASISGIVANNNTLYVSRNDEILKFNITDLTPLPDYCVDADGDGYYIGGEGCGELDCDDNNHLIYPNAEEKCDLIDWDCSGEPDNINKTDDCPESGNILGACAGSYRTCIGDGIWSECSIEPVEETYQTCDLVDDNCDGVIGFIEQGECLDTETGICVNLGQIVCFPRTSTTACPSGLDSECEDFNDCTSDKCVDNVCVFTEFSDIENCYYCVKEMASDCSSGMCGGADLNHDGSLNSSDYYSLRGYVALGGCDTDNEFCHYHNTFRDGEIDALEANLFVRALIFHRDAPCNLEPWRACELGIEGEEVCDDGFDNNCDGEIDEGCLPTLGFLQSIIEWLKGLFS